MKKVVGFDLDDTLVPEVLFLRSGIRHIAKWLHERFPELKEIRVISCMETALMTRRNHYSALETLLEETNLIEYVDMREVVSVFRNHIPDPAIYHPAPSTIELLNRVKETGSKMILITDGRSSTQRNKIKAAGLDAFFEEEDIFISEETGHDKTDPDTFLRVMEKHGGACEYHYVGDNPPKDFLHPSKLGWITHRVHPFPLAVHQGMPR